jgi:hypothetical protein
VQLIKASSFKFLPLPKNVKNAVESTAAISRYCKTNFPSPSAKNLLETDFMISISCNSYKHFMPSKAISFVVPNKKAHSSSLNRLEKPY